MNDRPVGRVLRAASITKLPADARGAVVVSGSHGGLYPGYLAARAGLRAVILNDAGVGKDQAGIRALGTCEGLGIAAAAVSHLSRIAFFTPSSTVRNSPRGTRPA